MEQDDDKSAFLEDSMKFFSAEHPKKILCSLNILRKASRFCDIKIIVANKEFLAHKALLSASSRYFEAMFTGGLSEENKLEIELHCISAQIFQILLEFIYSGFAEISKENVQELLAAANMLQLTEVVESCCSFLKTQLHPSNCIGIFRFAEDYNCIDLKTAAETFMHYNFLDMIKEEEYFELPKDILKTLLSSEQLRVDDEVQVFQAVMSWIFHDVVHRRRYIFQLLEAVRLPLIPDSFLDNYIKHCPDLSLQVALGKLIQDHRLEMRFLMLELRLGHCSDIRTQPRASARKNIMVIGGYNRDFGRRWSDSQTLYTTESFDSFKKQWKARAPMNLARSGHGVAVLNGLVYAVGGESDSLIFDTGEVYDPKENHWTLISSMTTPRSLPGMCSLDGLLYVFGGWVGSNIGNSVECYDPLAGVWKFYDQMTSPRCAMGVSAHQGLIYVVGGLSEMNTELDLVEQYNPVTEEWTQLRSLKIKRAHAGLIVSYNYLYAIGGSQYSGDALDSVERYSFEKNEWEDIQAMKYARIAPSVAVINGVLYVMGGRTSGDEFSASATLDSVECYDPQLNIWFETTPMLTSRCEAVAVVL